MLPVGGQRWAVAVVFAAVTVAPVLLLLVEASVLSVPSVLD